MMKRWAWVSCVVAGCLVAAAPSLLSLPPLKFAFVSLLEKKLHTSLSIRSLNLSWFGPQVAREVHFQNSDMDGTLQSFSSPLPFWSLAKMSSSFQLEGGVIQIHAPGYPPALISNVHAVVQGKKIEATASTSEEGKTGSVKVSADAQGAAVTVNGSGVNIPTVLVDRMVGGKGKLAALLGPSVDGKFTLKSEEDSGTLEANIASTNAQGSVSLAFTPSKITLKEPLLVNCRLTVESSQLLFKSKIQSQTPILLRVQPDGFSLPRSFSLSELQVGAATLDLGRFQIENSAAIGSVLTLLKKPQPPSTQWVNLWFTSIDATYKNGVLRLGRLDALLANAIHLCAWGDIHLVRDRLDLTLGLPADTLSQSFGIQNLSPNYVLKIPVEGTLQNPELITGPATAKIATMAATQLIPKPGPLNAFFKVINSAASDSNDVPPPKRPFPWEK